MKKFELMKQMKLLDSLLTEAEKISETIEKNLANKLQKAA